MMPEIGMEYRPVDITGLGLGTDAPFRFRWTLPGEEGSGESDDALVRSVESLGILSPPILSGTGDTLHVISGFRRIAAARETGLSTIPVLVADPDRQLPVWLESSLHGAPLSEMERLTLTAGLAAMAGREIEDHLPFLSILFGRRITAEMALQLSAMTSMSAEVREAIHDGRLSPGDLLQLGAHSGIDHGTAAELLAASGLSRSARREAIRGMLALADRGGDAFGKFAREYAPADMPLDEAIRTRTHPVMTGDTAFINRVIEDIELPPSASVRFPPNLEGGNFTVELRIRDEDELRIALSRLEEALEDGLFEEMLKVLRGES